MKKVDISTDTTLYLIKYLIYTKIFGQVSLGDTAVLECQASGAPRPSLVWTKVGGQLVATERHFFTADNQLLIIVGVEAADQVSCHWLTTGHVT